MRPDASVPQATQQQRADLQRRFDQFALSSCQQLVPSNDGANLFFSPLSLALALTITFTGAANETESVLRAVLCLDDLDLDVITSSAKAIMHQLVSPTDRAKLLLANSLWTRQGFTLDPDFVSRNEQGFGARAASLDFASPNASQIMNDWVAEHTGGHITDLLPKRINPLTVLFVLNAVYFKGAWATPFDERITQSGPFYLADGTRRQIKFMRQGGRLAYGRTRDLQMLSLPYAGDRLCLDILLPTKGRSPRDLLRGLTPTTLTRLFGSMSVQRGQIAVPRFCLESTLDLNQPLRDMGMAIAFESGGADFGPMVGRTDNPGLYISQVTHRAFIDVNEEGTVAAAASKVEIATRSMMMGKPFSFVADRPFLFLIRNCDTNGVVFCGIVADPE